MACSISHPLLPPSNFDPVISHLATDLTYTSSYLPKIFRLFAFLPSGSSIRASSKLQRALYSACVLGIISPNRDHARTIVSVLPSFRLPLWMDDVDDDVFILSDETSSEVRAASLVLSALRNIARVHLVKYLDSPQAALSILPELSRTVASSSTSSLSLSPPVILSPSTREEKAIAALTLALANVAAGINDYSTVWEALCGSCRGRFGAVDPGLDKLGLGSDINFCSVLHSNPIEFNITI